MLAAQYSWFYSISMAEFPGEHESYSADDFESHTITEAYIVDVERVAQSMSTDMQDLNLGVYIDRHRKSYANTSIYKNFINVMRGYRGRILAENGGSMTDDYSEQLAATLESESLQDGFIMGLVACEKLLGPQHDKVERARIDDLDQELINTLGALHGMSKKSSDIIHNLQTFGEFFYYNSLAHPNEADEATRNAINASTDSLRLLMDGVCSELYPDSAYKGKPDGYNKQSCDVANFHQGFGLVRVAYASDRMIRTAQLEEILQKT